MKLTSDSETLAENKVLILYILNNLNKPISNNGLFKLVLSIQDMNYFYFQQFLLDLLNEKYIIGYVNDGETLYKITQAGINTLELTNDLLPGILKLQIENTLHGEVQEVQNLKYAISEFMAKDENHFIVTCKIIENNLSIFEIKLPADSIEQAKTISKKWENNYTEIFPIIMELLTRKED